MGMSKLQHALKKEKENVGGEGILSMLHPSLAHVNLLYIMIKDKYLALPSM